MAVRWPGRSSCSSIWRSGSGASEPIIPGPENITSHWVCVNNECLEYNKTKYAFVPLVEVACGVCQQPCERKSM